ncbi:MULTISPECIES: alpha/beta fold hydrolase [unclassified Streptomyces]|uniref:alpha/beta fold hydrolase n=1 Tax=unclassified Streptomyces TaxID=2593676 RepID=UPI003413D3B5
MTAFILVAGAHTGGWIWEEVAARLRESGARVYPVTLTGMGDTDRPAGPGTDLETHVRDVLRLIDDTDAEEVVLVGHCYGIYPVLGAADRRPERISRIVHLDASTPQHGDRALMLVPDGAVRDRLSHRIDAEPDADADTGTDDWLIPPPAIEEWQRWGSVTGLDPTALTRLAENAVPQPVGTLTRPLRLTGAAAALPSTGVLCTGNGSSIAMVEGLVGLGDPRFQALAEPRVTFFELDTGHWPMLSRADEVAGILLRAAAGEGHRVTGAGSRLPGHLGPFLLDVPPRHRERTGRIDLHFPGDVPATRLGDVPADGSRDLAGDGPAGLPATEGPWPAVVFVHGGPVHPDVRPTPRDWPGFVGYARSVAGMGAVGVTLDHRLHDLADYGRAAEDIAEAVELVRADPRVDAGRVALWFFSAGGLLSADWLAAPPSWLRCVAATYPVLAPMPNWGLVDDRFRPAAAVRGSKGLPVVLTRVELERTEIAATVEEFLAAAKECEAEVEVIDVPGGRHGFETTDRSEGAREAVEQALRSVVGHLLA